MNSFIKIVFSALLAAVLFPMRIFGIKNNRLVFSGLTGGTTYEYSCNPKYICEYISQNFPGKFQICWMVSEPSRYREKETKDMLFCKHYSLRSFYYLLTAKVIVTSGSYAPWFHFRKRQYLINTWHGGGAYKKIENSKPDANWATKKRAQFCAKNIKLFLSSCTMASEQLFRGTFLYKGEIMEDGMPRNDFLVNGDIQGSRQKVNRFYHIKKEEKLILYAPTYRKSTKDIILDGESLLKVLSQKGEQWRILFRAHRYQDEQMHIGMIGGDYIDVSNYPDMQELLCAADMMITDYSSAIWDYSFLFRPCFLYVPDLEEYLEKTGFYVDIYEWPFPLAADQEKLEELLHNYNRKKAQERIKRHHQVMGCCESGQACHNVVSRILDVCEERIYV